MGFIRVCSRLNLIELVRSWDYAGCVAEKTKAKDVQEAGRSGKTGPTYQRIHELPLHTKVAVVLVTDALAWVLALFTVMSLRYDFGLTDAQWAWAIGCTVAAIAVQTLASLGLSFVRGRSRVASFEDVIETAGFVILVILPIGLILSAFITDFPRALAIVMPPLALVLMLAARGVYRILISRSRVSGNGKEQATPALVYGAGEAGRQVAQLVDHAVESPYRILGFVDDSPGKQKQRIREYQVLGTGKKLIKIAEKVQATTVILAVSNAPASMIQRVSRECVANGLDLVIIPPVSEMIGGRVSLDRLREFNVADLLGRRQIKTDVRSIADYVMGKRVLVTGAGGSIGSELSRQLNRLGPSKLILLDRDESELHAVRLSIDGDGLLDSDEVVLCDIREPDALDAIFEHHKPEVVFHAAALKHLPMLERYPLEGWKTNTLGSRNVLAAARKHGVEQFVNVSTDKAADATSVLGLTKRFAERLTSWHAMDGGMKYLSVRFGNVLGSRGSVLFTFRAQIERGGPVTVTDPDVTRYFMTIPEACELVLQAGAIGRPGDVLVLDMGEPVKIVDVAERLIAESGKDVEIHYTGLRKGEKLHEVLFSTSEISQPSAHPLISTVRVPSLAPADLPERPANRDEVLNLLEDEQQNTGAFKAVDELQDAATASSEGVN